MSPEKPEVKDVRAEAAQALRPHLSALVDGELEPLEAIAVQTHLRQSPVLEAEVREIEKLKLAVHLAGTRDKAPDVLETRLRAQCRAAFEARRAPSTSRWLVPLGGLVAAAAAVFVAIGGSAPATTPLAAIAVAGPPTIAGSDAVMNKLVDFHRGDISAMKLRDLQAAGVLETVERVPTTFLQDSARPKLVQASTMGCNERESGSTLAVLSLARIDLPQAIDNALEANGVYLDTIDGVDVRFSTAGGKLFVLLSGDGRSTSADPI